MQTSEVSSSPHHHSHMSRQPCKLTYSREAWSKGAVKSKSMHGQDSNRTPFTNSTIPDLEIPVALRKRSRSCTKHSITNDVQYNHLHFFSHGKNHYCKNTSITFCKLRLALGTNVCKKCLFKQGTRRRSIHGLASKIWWRQQERKVCKLKKSLYGSLNYRALNSHHVHGWKIYQRN